MTDKQTKARELMARLENLRADEPVLWAVVRGLTTEEQIGYLLGYTYKRVQTELKILHGSKDILRYYGKAWVINKKGPRYDSLAQLSKLARVIEAATINQFGNSSADLQELMRDRSLISAEGRALVKAKLGDLKTDRERGTPSLTEKQTQVWGQIQGWLEDQGRGGEPFTTREAAKAQGFDKPGFTKNVLLALVKKERARDLGGRPQKWQLIE